MIKKIIDIFKLIRNNPDVLRKLFATIRNIGVLESLKLIKGYLSRNLNTNSNNISLYHNNLLFNTGQKQLLLVDHHIPMPDRDAGSRTIMQFIECFQSLGYAVTFLPDNKVIHQPYTDNLIKLGVNVLCGKHFALNWQDYLRKNINVFDVILFSREYTSHKYLKFILKLEYKAILFYYGHDLGFIRFEQEYNLTPSKKLLLEIDKNKQAERYMYSNCDFSLTCSLGELQYLKDFVNKPVHYIPPFFFTPAPFLLDDKGCSGLIFIGNFRHLPNYDAMKWFLEEGYNKISDNIRFTIVGSNIPDDILNYSRRYSQLSILQNISDEELQNVYESSKISIAPLRIGAGVKGKVLEAMAYSKPVVGTSRAFEGIPDGYELDWLCANEIDGLIKLILLLEENFSLYNLHRRASAKYIKEHFSKEKMISVFQQLLIENT